MGEPRLLPDERVELALAPTALSRAPRYALALLPAAWGALLAFSFAHARWGEAATDMHELVAGLAMLLGMSLAAAACWFAGRRRMAILVMLAALGVEALALATRMPPAQAIPLALCGASVVLLGYVEVVRRRTRYLVTNLRILGVRPAAQARHEDIRDLDHRQGPLGRLFDVGTIIPVVASSNGAAPVLAGIHPYARVRQALELLVRRNTASDYLRTELALDEQVGHAMAALHRR